MAKSPQIQPLGSQLDTTILDALNDTAILVEYPTLTIDYLNHPARQKLRLKPGDSLEKLSLEAEHALGSYFKDHIEQSLSRQNYLFEWNVVYKKNTDLWFEFAANLVASKAGTYVLLIGRDISARERNESQNSCRLKNISKLSQMLYPCP